MKKIAIVQSNYIPWKGYFDMIAAVDEFILYDDMQYTRRDWRNRNQIKTPQGVQWLTVPVQVKGKYEQKIRETAIDGTEWADSHWKTLLQNYRKAPHFMAVSEWLEPIYRQESFQWLSELNRRLLEAICERLNIQTRISNSWDYTLEDGKTERLVSLCVQAGATEYISGPAANGYLDEDAFKKKGVSVRWFEYGAYPPYPQRWGDFVHGVSVLDLLFNTGNEASKFMKHAPKILGATPQ